MANNKMNIEGKNYSDIPVWRRYTLTIEEAARYYHIGEGKLRTLIDTHPETNCQGLFNQIHRKLTKGARSTVWLLTPHLTDYIFPFSRSLQRYA